MKKVAVNLISITSIFICTSNDIIIATALIIQVYFYVFRLHQLLSKLSLFLLKGPFSFHVLSKFMCFLCLGFLVMLYTCKHLTIFLCVRPWCMTKTWIQVRQSILALVYTLYSNGSIRTAIHHVKYRKPLEVFNRKNEK